MHKMKIIDKLAWIEIKDKKILSTKSKGKAVFYLPGGKREAGESDEVALLREIKEELDVDLDPTSLQFLGIFEEQAHGHAEGVIVKMQCYTGRYSGQLKASAEIENFDWLDSSNMDIISPVDKIIFKWLHDRGLIQ